MSFSAITFIAGSFSGLFWPRGNTTTTFGAQEWLIRATSGETETPIGVSDGEVRATVLVMN